MIFKHVTHCIFEMDGVILNTEDLYEQAIKNVVTPYGKTYPFALKREITGLPDRQIAEAVVKELQIPLTVEEFMEKCKKECDQLFPTSELMPGAREILVNLRRQNVPIALATGCSEESYLMKAARHQELFAMFQHKTFGSESAVVCGKPDPDLFLLSASKFDDHPKWDKVLVFECSVMGVKAARAGGMQAVIVPDSRLSRTYCREAALLIGSLELFTPELFGLPSF